MEKENKDNQKASEQAFEDDDQHAQNDRLRMLRINLIFHRSKLCVLLFALILGSLAVFFTFSIIQEGKEEGDDRVIDAQLSQISAAIRFRFDHITQSSEAFATTIGLHAEALGRSWPFETFPKYEVIASNYRLDFDNKSAIGLLPIVRDSEKSEWQEYSTTHQSWIKESYDAMDINVTPLQIQPFIHDMVEQHATESQDGPFLPVWQLSPPPSHPSVINYNMASQTEFESAFKSVEMGDRFALSRFVGETIIFEAEEGKHSALVVPIQTSYKKSTAPVAFLFQSINWELLLSNLGAGLNNGRILCTVSNSCGEGFDFELSGTAAKLLGRSDSDDKDHVNLFSIVLASSIHSDSCDYELFLRSESQTSQDTKAVIYSSLVGILFVLSALGFLLYDFIVQRRQQELVSEAARTDAIVSSLFPAEVRDRLYKGQRSESIKVTDPSANKISQDPRHLEAPKSRLKTYLREEDETQEQAPESNQASTAKGSKPIADLFPNTTIMFADIAGFTAWSSVREPSQVFTLLETVYKKFDTVAKRKRVFKVETVGDCYVAVTGLPEPLDTHAPTMCEFARECFTHFNILVRQLEVLLGPDTGDLAIRVGLHSGPVTAGVLRGDKSRFQLFGDTVNTAARIESTGFRNRIHLSHETAELLYKAGKPNWLRKRTETIVAKGKGEMQTYWLLTNEELASGVVGEDVSKTAAPLPIVRANAPRIASAATDALDPESTLPPRIKRLVDWNVDVLKKLLQKIVAKRNATEKEKLDPNHPTMMKTEVNIGCDTYVLDEVTEIVRLPKYTHLTTVEDPRKVELPSEVIAQLRLYVASVAAMHRDNPFHNFEHASHVMMSVSKLLSRIVAPDDIVSADDAEDKVGLNLHDHTYGITSDPLTQFSVVLAALIHDTDHSGVSNFQLIKENAKIATVFKNKSIAEQNSIVLAWDRLMESRFMTLRSFIYSDPDELKRFRQLMVNTVLATDIFDKELQTLRKTRWERAFQKISDDTGTSTDDDINRKATIVIEHLIQASDVSHTMQHWHIYQKWNERLFAEMMFAHKTGRMETNPADNWYQGELGFFDNYIIPLAKKLKDCGVFGVSSDEYLNYAEENRREWKVKGEQIVSKYSQTYGVGVSGNEDSAERMNSSSMGRRGSIGGDSAAR